MLFIKSKKSANDLSIILLPLAVTFGGLSNALWLTSWARGQALCDSRNGRPGLPIRNSPSGLCGRKATLKKKKKKKKEKDLS